MRYRFGEFTLDPDTRQLLRKDLEVHLSPKAFDLLLLLIANRDRAISKTELQQMLWPSTFVEETNLAGLVVDLRRALHDAAGAPKFIRTVYAFGYRFVGDVILLRPSAEASSPALRFVLSFLGRQVLLLEGANVIGRATDVAIRIDTPGMSRRHAQITVSGTKATLEDLGSKNGTRLNGRPVSGPSELADGDLVLVAAVELVFHAGTDVTATETLTTTPNQGGR